MKKTTLFLLFALLIIACNGKQPKKVNNLETKREQIKKQTTERLKEKAKQALAYCKAHNMNTNFCILADFGVHSGLNRLFVWNFSLNKVVKESVVSHGCGESPWGTDYTKEKVVFSNVSNSHCSSKGKYRIGSRGASSWGIRVNYKMHGLESTNRNAYRRIIVLHSWKDVPDQEIYPDGTPEGWGCPAVSNNMMRYLDKKLKIRQKPVLFWIYE